MTRNDGLESEDKVEQICSNSFLADFVVRGPKYRTKSNKLREYSDLLLPFKDHLITFQIKTRQLNDHIDIDNPKHIKRLQKRISHAVTQIKSIKRAIDTKSINEVINCLFR